MKTSWMTNAENDRLTWFLMGAVLTLAVLFTALEYTSSSSYDDADESLLEDVFAEIEPYPMVETNTAVEQQEEKKEIVSMDLLKIADTDLEGESTTDDAQTEVNEGTDALDADDTDKRESDVEKLLEEEKEALEPLDFRVVQQIPEFPGGMRGFVKWLTANLKYPASAQKRKVEGKVVITFIVNTDGSTTNMRVAQAADDALNKEALRVMNTMPKWKPGLENNKPCRTMMAIPIIFKQ